MIVHGAIQILFATVEIGGVPSERTSVSQTAGKQHLIIINRIIKALEAVQSESSLLILRCWRSVGFYYTYCFNHVSKAMRY